MRSFCILAYSLECLMMLMLTGSDNYVISKSMEIIMLLLVAIVIATVIYKGVYRLKSKKNHTDTSAPQATKIDKASFIWSLVIFAILIIGTITFYLIKNHPEWRDTVSVITICVWIGGLIFMAMIPPRSNCAHAVDESSVTPDAHANPA